MRARIVGFLVMVALNLSVVSVVNAQTANFRVLSDSTVDFFGQAVFPDRSGGAAPSIVLTKDGAFYAQRYFSDLVFHGTNVSDRVHWIVTLPSGNYAATWAGTYSQGGSGYIWVSTNASSLNNTTLGVTFSPSPLSFTYDANPHGAQREPL